MRAEREKTELYWTGGEILEGDWGQRRPLLLRARGLVEGPSGTVRIEEEVDDSAGERLQ